MTARSLSLRFRSRCREWPVGRGHGEVRSTARVARLFSFLSRRGPSTSFIPRGPPRPCLFSLASNVQSTNTQPPRLPSAPRPPRLPRSQPPRTQGSRTHDTPYTGDSYTKCVSCVSAPCSVRARHRPTTQACGYSITTRDLVPGLDRRALDRLIERLHYCPLTRECARS